MLPLFTTPLALWGLLALPILVVLYSLRVRPRRYSVSSLMLWLDAQESLQGGTRLDRLLTPLLFFLELLALTLLILAAANPHLPLRERVRPLIVVLDDSYSMQASGPRSPRNEALKALEEELTSRPRPSVRFLLAGDRSQALGETAYSTPEALAQLRDWRGRAASSRLEEALSLAGELDGELPLLLVLTDREPSLELKKGRIQWWAFGQPRANFAIVNAARTAREGGERCFLEITNFSDSVEETTLVLETGDPPAEWRRSLLRLQSRESRRVVVTLPEKTGLFIARIDDDELMPDNWVCLLPNLFRPLRTSVRVKNETLREAIDKALQATQRVERTDKQPDLVFIDSPETRTESDDSWIIRLLADQDAEAYTGPFVLNRNHPLTEGLSLNGVIWGAGKSRDFPGIPVILVGNVPLLTDMETNAGNHEILFRLRQDRSTLTEAPGWPILFWNLLQWRASEKPGLHRANFRLGEQVELTFATPRSTVVVTRPEVNTQTLTVQKNRLLVRPDDVGRWFIEAEEESTSFVVNALSANESDLSHCTSGRWGDWQDETSLRLEYQNIAWILLLFALVIVTVHLYLAARLFGRSGKKNSQLIS